MTSVNINDLNVSPNIISAAIRGGFTTPEKILEASTREIMRNTGLREHDVEQLVMSVIQLICPPCRTVWDLHNSNGKEMLHLSFGSESIDSALGGGVPSGKVTEIAGESGSGKTQICLYLSLRAQLTLEKGGLARCVAYLCTEMQFPSNRLTQLINGSVDRPFNGKHFSDNIYVHHLRDMDNLVDCVRYKLPHLIHENNVGLIVIDSVAAVFRANEERQENKSKMVQQLGFLLHQLSCKHNVAVIAVNQVSAAISESFYGIADSVIPSLGLGWANIITTRLSLYRSSFCIPYEGPVKELRVRILKVIFCPWLPRRSCTFIVTENGIEDVQSPKDLVLASD